jgi:hypothetical protein
MHVLELAVGLGLSPEQRAHTEAIFTQMQASARRLGAQLVEAERELDMLFRSRQVVGPSLDRAVERIASLLGQLRAVHLRAHVEQALVLTPEQTASYAKLRGYAANGESQGGQHTHP